MDSIPYDSIILLGALLLFSAYFSASETSITSVNKIRLKYQADHGNIKAKRSLKLAENFDQSLSTMLVGNNIVNIAMASIGTAIATELFGSQGSTIVVATFVITIMVLIFGEIIPKSLAKNNAEKFLMAMSSPLTVLMKLFYPVTWLFLQLQRGVSKLLGSNKEEPTVTEEDVKALVEIGEEEGTFLSQEKELLHNAIEFDDILVKDILVPRLDVIAVDVRTSIEDIKEVFINEKYSRIPIYDGSIDNIIGIISHRDFFPKYVRDPHFQLTEIIRKPYFTVPSIKISTLLKDLQQNKVQLAIVLDEYGGTAGIVTMEDIIEEIVGEIWDEYDDNEVFYETIDEYKMRLRGRMPIEEFCELLKIEIPETSSNTLSGWISDLFGYLPQKGEQVSFANLIFLIEEVRNRRIEKVIVEINKESMQTA